MTDTIRSILERIHARGNGYGGDVNDSARDARAALAILKDSDEWTPGDRIDAPSTTHRLIPDPVVTS